ncbi:MAG TPA: serine/threonine-protein kinase [Kofleriaceae bacterium]
MASCPSPDDWFALGSNPELEHHLDQCDECRAVAAMIGRAGVLGNAPTASGDPVGIVPELVAPGTTLGRFVVRGAVGVGGMGVVLEAFDAKLERTVALKVVRRMRDDASWERARDRVLAEAKAMARLSHPNVVAIHDLVEIGEERLIAMEFVAGPDLETWLAQEPTPQQRLAVVLGLGEGLAAAHDAGVVHRDIKPTNILIANGQARVTDFGLAALAGGESPSKGGTPGYVAPELVAGSNADARSDQFAFAVTAWRTLFDRWPVDGGGSGAAATVLERAMAIDPAARYPSMRAVVEALRRASRRHVARRWIIGAASVIAITGIGLASYKLSQPKPTCEVPITIDAAWSPTNRAAWQTAMQSKIGHDATRLAGEIDRAWVAWQAAATAACERPTAGTIACVRSLRRRLVSLIEHAAATQDPTLIDDSLAIARATDCVAAPPPQRTALAPAALVLHELTVAQFDDVTTLTWLGQYRPALVKLDALLARVPAEDEPLRGELLYRKADVLSRLGDTAGSLPVLQEALTIAERGSNPIARVNTMILLLTAYDELGRIDEALALAKVAEAAALAVPFDAMRAVRLASVLAGIAYSAGKFDEAERKYREAVAINDKRFADRGGKDPEMAGSLHNLGMVVHALGRAGEAADLQRRALAMFEQTLGPEHPNTALAVNQLAALAYEAKRYDEAAQLHRRTIAIWEKSLGPGHPNLSEPLMGLGRSEAARGHEAEAIALYRRARTAALGLGEDHPLVALAEYRLAEVLADRKEAAQLIEHAAAAWDASGMDVPDAHLARFMLAQFRWTAGRRIQARQLAEHAREALAKLDTRYADTVKEIDQWLATHR